jgi:catechol 2,3-dioxygenase-like lactoylglutathione lyase family enzyme
MTAAARWKELCMDTTGGEGLGRFWAAATGARFEPGRGAGDPGNVVAEDPGGSIAMCPVPEARTVKHRVHLDVYAASVDDLVALGARVLLPAEQSGLRWTVMADPEGGEFCAFVREPAELPSYRCHGLVVDSADPQAQCRWWGRVLGVEPADNDGRGFWTLTGIPGDPITTMDFVPVPEPKTVKNRVHWDVYGDPAEMERAGASVLRRPDGEIRWTVMADPEGNEFCVFGR